MNKMKLSEWIFTSVMACALSVLWLAYTFVYNILSPVLKASGADGLLTGVWLMGSTFFAYIIRKPFAALWGEVCAALVQGLFSYWGISSVMYGFVQAAPVELLCFLCAYRIWNIWFLSAAGFLSGLASFALSYVWYHYASLSLWYQVVQGLTCAISGAFFAGFLSKYLADRLAKTGALNAFRIMQK